jgi:hypothetical protein
VHGPEILVRSLSVPAVRQKGTQHLWQYHPRSDRHSKIACWGILFDLLQHSSVLRQHIADGRVAFGVNHEMSDFRVNRQKRLDLVVCTPREGGAGRTLADLTSSYQIDLSRQEQAILDTLPSTREAPVGAVRIALEAKACMTAHVRALPRLYDELNSSHLTVHGAANHAVAIGLSMINFSDEFLSPDINKADPALVRPTISQHRQPNDTLRVLDKLHQLPRRTRPTEEGFDAFGIVIVECKNDGSRVRLVKQPPAPQPGDIFDYAAMIRKATSEYESRFR